jgi:hypothetical protein
MIRTVGHAQVKRSFVLENEVLIFKLLSVDRLASAAVKVCEISSLDHKVRNYAMKDRSLVVQRLSLLSDSLLACAEGTEVISGLGDSVAEKSENDTAAISGSLNFDIEKDLVGDPFLIPVAMSGWCGQMR